MKINMTHFTNRNNSKRVLIAEMVMVLKSRFAALVARECFRARNFMSFNSSGDHMHSSAGWFHALPIDFLSGFGTFGLTVSGFKCFCFRTSTVFSNTIFAFIVMSVRLCTILVEVCKRFLFETSGAYLHNGKVYHVLVTMSRGW